MIDENSANKANADNYAQMTQEAVGELSVNYHGFVSYKLIKDLPAGYHKLYTSQPNDKAEIDKLVTERDQLLARNAELVKALKNMFTMLSLMS